MREEDQKKKIGRPIYYICITVRSACVEAVDVDAVDVDAEIHTKAKSQQHEKHIRILSPTQRK